MSKQNKGIIMQIEKIGVNGLGKHVYDSAEII